MEPVDHMVVVEQEVQQAGRMAVVALVMALVLLVHKVVVDQ